MTNTPDLIERRAVEQALDELLSHWTQEGRDSVHKLIEAVPSAPVEPVPAPRLEWTETEDGDWQSDSFFWIQRDVDGMGNDNYYLNYHNDDEWMAARPTLDAAKSLAEKLNAVLSPPVGTQE